MPISFMLATHQILRQSSTMKHLLFSILCLTILAFSSHHSNAQRSRNVSVTPYQISDSIYMIEGQGGNIGFLMNTEGVLLVDTQFQHMAPAILKSVGELSQGKIKYVLNTHFHGDHTGGNATLGANATIVAHKKVQTRLNDNSRTQPGAVPKLTYDKKMDIQFGEENVSLIHLGPGHTDTDSVVIFNNSNVIHMGDHFFNGRFPFVDLNSGGSVEGYLANIKQVAEMADEKTVIIPGHGSLASKQDLLAFISMFEECLKIVSNAKNNGLSLEETQKLGLPEKYQKWGEAFINHNKWISFLYQGI